MVSCKVIKCSDESLLEPCLHPLATESAESPEQLHMQPTRGAVRRSGTAASGSKDGKHRRGPVQVVQIHLEGLSSAVQIGDGDVPRARRVRSGADRWQQ
mmetsp:Transcript_28103/g.86169  ORF Transcript_28103/g.86169 Transcript_28103/m.86169 type:complete len:99 (+) Transcript_28103:1036-1332(+)